MSNINPIIAALSGLLCLAFGYWLATIPRYKWMRFRKRLKCLVGKHEPGTPEDRVGGRRVQTCDWCGKDVREYQVTKNEALGEKITRIR